MTQAVGTALLARIKGLATLWRGIAGRGGDEVILAPDLPAEDLAHLRGQMQACLEARGGEVSARTRAAVLGRAYLGLNTDGRLRFLRLLAEEFGPDRGDIDAAIDQLRSSDGDDRARAEAERALRQSLEPPRLKLLTDFNGLPEGIKFLVDMRAELMGQAKDDPALTALEGDLKGLLAAWFDIGFLELRRITWRSPAMVLEKIMAYEAVHAIQGWGDLKNRLDSDRRLYGFFHPRMPDEPLIFVEVALVEGIAGNVQELLDPAAPLGDPQAADTAIFYSITNAQKGLAGISFGNFLIKRVVDDLSREFPRLKTFATLSPIPGFRDWLSQHLHQGEVSNDAKGSLKTLLAEPEWVKEPAMVEALKGPLLRLAARYLLSARRGDGRALDPVAHFHLSNGARVERLNWLGDLSPKGVAQSCGLMVNYLYKLDGIEANHEAYSASGKVAASGEVRALGRG
jgi:malonyl-CoA decarboxylase